VSSDKFLKILTNEAIGEETFVPIYEDPIVEQSSSIETTTTTTTTTTNNQNETQPKTPRRPSKFIFFSFFISIEF